MPVLHQQAGLAPYGTCYMHAWKIYVPMREGKLHPAQVFLLGWYLSSGCVPSGAHIDLPELLCTRAKAGAHIGVHV
eukprot:scaffold282858_cov21-Tisochrysis_lutea.AAC.1